jgi:tetratricopeptide (TPR) repeat protein
LATVDRDRTNDGGKVIVAVEKALELDPEFEPALNMLRSIISLGQDLPAALEAVDRLEAATGSTMSIHMVRAEILVKMGDEERARKSYAAARPLARTSTEFNHLCWDQATAKIGLEDALKDCDMALELEPDCGPCLDSRGFVLLQLERNDEAVASYDKSLAVVPTQAMSLYGRGIAKLRLNRQEEGEADMAAALEIAPAVERTFAGYGIER